MVDHFFGLANASLSDLDLREQSTVLRHLTFDTRTIWPPRDRLPNDFDPVQILEQGKNPGLGVRALHAQGIDGRGVRIAIIDLPLFLYQREYADRLAIYEDQWLGIGSPQMHGAPVASIAVGRTCGVAPRASLAFFSAPMGPADNACFCFALDRIMELNRNAKPAERIRVVSISNGMFSQLPHYQQWQQELQEVTRQGILVITCDPESLRYGTLSLLPGRDPDDFQGYRRGRYSAPHPLLLVPAARTVAGHEGADIYTYWPQGGMSWCAPYLAGLAALAYQTRPDVQPQEVTRLLVETATPTSIGPIVNPKGFIDAVSRAR